MGGSAHLESDHRDEQEQQKEDARWRDFLPVEKDRRKRGTTGPDANPHGLGGSDGQLPDGQG